jgi:thiol-disulfide isomerase/thioredoxin
LNEENLVSYYGYQNYVISHLYNLGYSLKENDSSKDDIDINILNAIIENVELESFKNRLLTRLTVDNFLKSESTCTINEETLSIFLDNCSDEGMIKHVKNLVSDTELVVSDEPLHNFEILSYDNEILDISSVIENKNSMIYFWTSEHIPPDYMLKRVKDLEQYYPDIEFIGINIESASKDVFKDPSLKKLDINKQFKLTSNSYANNYLTSNYPRIIIVNKDGIVKNGFTLFASKKLDSELKKLEIN